MARFEQAERSMNVWLDVCWVPIMQFLLFVIVGHLCRQSHIRMRGGIAKQFEHLAYAKIAYEFVYSLIYSNE